MSFRAMVLAARAALRVGPVRFRAMVLAAVAGLAITPAAAHGQATFRHEATRVNVEPNVIYGMVSGLALLLDVYRPDRPNGRGLVVIPGTGWHAALAYDAPPLKGARPGGLAGWLAPLTDAGYTLFVINHRAAPRFRYPDPLHDAQRAVRFVRHHAERFGVDPDRLGAVGHSSGGHLVGLLGTLDGAGDAAAQDPVARESARVQAVVAGSAPMDLTAVDEPWPTSIAAVFLGQARTADSRSLYREASPLSHVSADAAPFLLIHGDADAVVPFRNSELMHAALLAAGVPAELMRIEGGDHQAFPIERAAAWLDEQLLGHSTAGDEAPSRIGSRESLP